MTKVYTGREKVLNFYNGYTRVVSEAKYKSIQGEGLKILTRKQMFQRLPIILVQVKAGISKLTYFLCIEQKKLLKR